MVSVKVSEKTLELLKNFKKKEQIKTLDGVIRYLLNAYGWLEATSFRQRGRLVPILSLDLAKELTEYEKERDSKES